MMTYGRTVYIGEQHPFKQIQSIFDGECYIYVGNKTKISDFIFVLFFWMDENRQKGKRPKGKISKIKILKART